MTGSSSILLCGFLIMLWPREALALQEVPVIPCPRAELGDGGGRIEKRDGPPLAVDLPAEVAAELNFYEAGDSNGVLAPRGWQCDESIGPGGLLLQAHPKDEPVLEKAQHWSVSLRLTNNSSGSSTALTYDYIVDFFPQSFPKFVREIESAAPYYGWNFHRRIASREEIRTYKGDRMVEISTLAEKPDAGSAPAHEVIVLIGTDDPPRPGIVDLTVRLPPDRGSLQESIIGAFEKCRTGFGCGEPPATRRPTGEP